MQEEFKVIDTVYYVGPEIEGRSHPEFGESCMVQRINGDSITAVSTHFILEVSKEHLSKTPPAKEKSSDNKDSINRLSRAPSAYSTGSASDALKDLTDSVQKKQLDDLSDEDIMSGWSDAIRKMHGHVEKSAFTPIMDFLNSFPENDEPECQNPTALILRQIADQIESGSASIVKSDYSFGRIDQGVRTTITVEIVEGAGGDRE